MTVGGRPPGRWSLRCGTVGNCGCSGSDRSVLDDVDRDTSRNPIERFHQTVPECAEAESIDSSAIRQGQIEARFDFGASVQTVRNWWAAGGTHHSERPIGRETASANCQIQRQRFRTSLSPHADQLQHDSASTVRPAPSDPSRSDVHSPVRPWCDSQNTGGRFRDRSIPRLRHCSCRGRVGDRWSDPIRVWHTT